MHTHCNYSNGVKSAACFFTILYFLYTFLSAPIKCLLIFIFLTSPCILDFVFQFWQCYMFVKSTHTWYTIVIFLKTVCITSLHLCYSCKNNIWCQVWSNCKSYHGTKRLEWIYTGIISYLPTNYLAAEREAFDAPHSKCCCRDRLLAKPTHLWPYTLQMKLPSNYSISCKSSVFSEGCWSSALISLLLGVEK
jgi:hypothetical protein